MNTCLICNHELKGTRYRLCRKCRFRIDRPKCRACGCRLARDHKRSICSPCEKAKSEVGA